MLWEMVTGIKDDYAVLVPDYTGTVLESFDVNGRELHWRTAPTVMPFVDPKRKKQKPRGDIEYLTWGAIVLNERAYQVLHAALGQFGQFLPLSCLGVPLYFYNVTTLHQVVDAENSEKIETTIAKPAFLADAIPNGCCIFKDKLTANVAIYLNDETKNTLEKLITENKLTGLYFIPAGSF